MSLEGLAIQLNHQFEIISCYKCACLFAVPAAVRSRWVDSGDSFFCPNGHSQHYTQSTVQKLQKQIAEKEKLLADEKRRAEFARQNAAAERAARERTERSNRAIRAAATRVRNRIKNGVCPCCTRTFVNLQRHMTTQHPGFRPTHVVTDPPKEQPA
jgi:hypothetical protein